MKSDRLHELRTQRDDIDAEISALEGGETLDLVYSGEFGPPWVAFLDAKKAEGWFLIFAKVIDEKSGRVIFSRTNPLAGRKKKKARR